MSSETGFLTSTLAPIFLSACVGWPIGYVVRPSRKQPPEVSRGVRPSRLIAGLASLVDLTILTSFVVVLSVFLMVDERAPGVSWGECTMADYLLGIDYGTGGAKACIINAEGDVLGFTFEEYPFIHEKPGWSEHDPHVYWAVCCRLINGAIEEANVDAKEIRGIAVSSALPSLVMVDEGHVPINQAYNLMDRRAVKEVAWLKRHVGEDRLFQITGNRLEDHPTIVNLLWEKDNRPDSYAKIWKALTRPIHSLSAGQLLPVRGGSRAGAGRELVRFAQPGGRQGARGQRGVDHLAFYERIYGHLRDDFEALAQLRDVS